MSSTVGVLDAFSTVEYSNEGVSYGMCPEIQLGSLLEYTLGAPRAN